MVEFDKAQGARRDEDREWWVMVDGKSVGLVTGNVINENQRGLYSFSLQPARYVIKDYSVEVEDAHGQEYTGTFATLKEAKQFVRSLFKA